ncbi:MAG: hypothetical protein PHN51_06525 [Candidatus Nanopelagicales bacterium]|nr:hypothetical protein [Candidatus Nanopelagicales bacterium]
MIAFVDESYNAERYLLAAAVVSKEAIDSARQAMWGLRLPGQRKLHWRNEHARRRLQIAVTISQVPLSYLVVIRSATVGERTERQRRRCLEFLINEFAKISINEVVFESRSSTEDKFDRALIDALRAKKYLGTGLRIHHVLGMDEPLLWVADAVCGITVEYLNSEGEAFKEFIHEENLRIYTLYEP